MTSSPRFSPNPNLSPQFLATSNPVSTPPLTPKSSPSLELSNLVKNVELSSGGGTPHSPGGRPQLMKHPSLILLKKDPKWSEKAPSELFDLDVAAKELGFCDNVFACFVKTNNYYVKIEVLETRDEHCTEPVRINPSGDSRKKESFSLDERYSNTMNCGLNERSSPEGLTFRAAVYNSVLGSDKLVGYGQTSLDSLTHTYVLTDGSDWSFSESDDSSAPHDSDSEDCSVPNETIQTDSEHFSGDSLPTETNALPINLVNKKPSKKAKKRKSKKGRRKKWKKCERPKESAKTLYLSLPTHNDDRFTGELYFKFDYNRQLPFFKVSCLGVIDACPKYDWDDPVDDGGFGLKEVGISMFLVMHILGCALIMQRIEGNNDPDCEAFADFRDCLWFVLVTFASVGYGDMYPCTDQGRVANGFMILSYQLTLAWFFSIAAQLFLMPTLVRLRWPKSEAFRQYIERIWSCILKDKKARFDIGDKVLTRDELCDLRTAIVQDVVKEYDEVEQDWDIRYELTWLTDTEKETFFRIEEQLRKIKPLNLDKLFWQLIGVLVKTGALVLFVVGIGTIMFHHFERDAFLVENGFNLTYANTFHFSLATMSTVGYGDWAPYTTSGRAFGSFFILCGVTLLANFAGIVVGYFLQREELLNSQEFLNNSLVTPEQILDFDMDGDGEISKYEYLVKSLLQCKFVREDKIDLIMAKFYDIDTDKSGQISLEDFQHYASITEEEDVHVDGHLPALTHGEIAGELPVE